MLYEKCYGFVKTLNMLIGDFATRKGILLYRLIMLQLSNKTIQCPDNEQNEENEVS